MPTRRTAAFLVAFVLAAATAHAASIESLAWLTGSWSGTSGNVQNEEHWTAPTGGLMVAMHKDVRGGKAVSFEFLRIVARGDTLTYVSMPNGRNETRFPLKELSGKRVVFENPDHDFPQRILYWQDQPNELRARIEGTVNGKEESEEWTWKRAKLAK